MSVMTPAQLQNGGRVDMRGRPMGPLDEAPPPAMARDAVMDQLGAPPPGAPPGGGPIASSPFARGGVVKQLPGAGTAGKIGDIGLGVGTRVAANQLGRSGAQAAAGGAASSGLKSALTSGASGAAAGAGISIGTDLLANKLRDKEEMPTFGGEFGSYTDDLGRRFQGTGGGIASNAVKYAGYGANPALAASTMGLSVLGGAAAGAIKGAITKHAKSAYSDFKVEDAANAIKAQYQKELGRPASDDEVQAHLAAQGWDPTGGDRWVGEKGLIGKGGVMDAIRSSPEAADFKRTGVAGGARQAVIDQLGASGGTATTDLAGRAGQGAAGDTPAAPAGGAPGDTSGWNTDGYAAPAYTPPSVGAAMPGWDGAKWADPNHQTPKYGAGRILSQFPPTVDGLSQAAEAIAKAYPGTTFNGKDTLTIPGVGAIDVLKGAGNGGEAWQWMPKDGGGADASGGPTAGAATASGAGVTDDGGDVLAQLQAAIERIQNGTPDRSALLANMGAA